MGRLKKVPTSTMAAKTSMMRGRHERCNQLPCASAPMMAAWLRRSSSSWRAMAAIKSASICFFSLDETERVFTTAPISPIKFESNFITFCF